MNIKDSKNNKETKNKKEQQPRLRSVAPRVSVPQNRPTLADNYYKNNSRPHIISGYFIEDKSYKELEINKINTILSWTLAVLVLLSMISYYFVITCEIELNQIRRETVVLTEENAELQVELYKRKSYDKIEKFVSKHDNLGRANTILKVPVKDDVQLNNNAFTTKTKSNWAYGF
ncbi:hypothetical protein IKA92_01590 [bacterium]|nr:hypothetical protein [bacterium]